MSTTAFNTADSHQSPARKESLYAGDIKLTQQQQDNMKKYGNPYGPQSRAASSVPKERWPNAVIPYTFDCSVGEPLLNLVNMLKIFSNIYQFTYAILSSDTQSSLQRLSIFWTTTVYFVF